MAYKVFTNGSVLQASEINDNLMRQSVIVFSNAAARTAAITSPIEGMLTWLEDVNRYESYDGSAWVSPYGTTLLNKTSFTTQTSVTVNNVFSAQYQNYLIEMRFQQNTSGAGITYTLVNGATPSASNWAGQQILLYANGLTQFSNFVNAAGTELYALNPGQGSLRINLFSPFETAVSFGQATAIYQSSGAGANPSVWQNSQLDNTTSFEGFRISASAGTMTGTLKIYGMRD